MKPHVVTEDQIKLRAFPFSLQDSAREWLYDLPSGSITTWTELAKLFLEKYFPKTRVSILRSEILGLTPMERRLINASSGGSLGDMTPTEIRELIEKLAIESKHSGNKDRWYPDQPRGVKEISNGHLEAQLSELTKVVLLLTKEKAAATKQCWICMNTDHPTNMCPILQEDTVAPPPGFQQRRIFQQSGFQQNFQNQQNFQHQDFQQPLQQYFGSSSMALEDIVKKSQGKLLRHTENSPKHNVSAISLRSGKTYEGPRLSEPENKIEEEYEEVMVKEVNVEETEKEVEAEEYEEVLVEEEAEKETPTLPKPILKEYKPLPPFPSRLRSTKRERDDEDSMEMLRKVEIYVPLLDIIQHIPRYAKFIKNLCNSKEKMKFNEIVNAGENISFILRTGLPPKCKDPRIFLVPCKLGKINFPKAMLDLGASTETIIQLADHSTVHPKCVLEDVLVQVDNLIFPVDFYIFDMGNLDTSDANSIILGRPFMKTAKTKIDVFAGTLSMEFDVEVVNFKINNDDFPSENISVNYIGTNNPLLEGCCVLSNISMQEKFVDKNLSYTSGELAKDKLGENEGGNFTVEKEFVEVDKPEKKLSERAEMELKRNKLLEEKEGNVSSDINMKRKESENDNSGKKKEVQKTDEV
ncbi:uncharacterized protein LOC111897240 [Lactuca sativa]|uniref:uncharacterized protein LOC111897240 n=1 Tax=Lactuca sativa TaxID=4236 RepID=UPI000CD970A9|nr:uncharacterized protein LOC111897240 [Lactuca sativa]